MKSYELLSEYCKHNIKMFEDLKSDSRVCLRQGAIYAYKDILTLIKNLENENKLF